MRFLILTVIVFGAVGAIALLLRSTSVGAESASPPRDPAELSAKLRSQLLHGTASEFSIEPVSGVWGVLMEIGYPDAAATLVALGDGTASLYLSSGGGVIGGGPHPSINEAARRLVGLAGGYTTKMSQTSDFPLPASGEVTFYVLTTKGVLKADAREKALSGGKHPLSELFFAGHDVITGLRKVTEERKK